MTDTPGITSIGIPSRSLSATESLPGNRFPLENSVSGVSWGFCCGISSAAGPISGCTAFGEVLKSEGLRIITTLPKTPRMNAICERVNGTLRRELLDRTLILGERHLALVLREYMEYYNGHRPHQSRQQRPPDSEAQPVRDVADLRSVRRKPVVAGVINEYHHAA
jgi:hypothetical protein